MIPSIEYVVHDTTVRCSEEFQRNAGLWLCHAPEYLLTASLYRALPSVTGVAKVRPESPISDLVREADIRGRGVPPRDMRFNGRADLGVWGRRQKPIGMIEVKCPARSYCEIKEDVDRVSSIYYRYPNENSMRFCGIAFYLDACDGAIKSSSDKVHTYIRGIQSQMNCWKGVTGKEMRVGHRRYWINRFSNRSDEIRLSYVIREVPSEESAWASCLILWNRQ